MQKKDDMLNESTYSKRNVSLRPLPKQRAVKAIVLEAYEEGGSEAARKALKIAEERIIKTTGRKFAYPVEILDEWIKEYEEQQTR